MAAKIWVSATASGKGDGNRAAPYKTIEDALDAAAPGTTIMVLPGTYAENVIVRDSGTADAPIVLRAAGAVEETVIRPASDEYDTIDIGGADHIVIDGFTIHAPQTEMNGVAVYARTPDDGFDTASHVTIRNNVIVGGNGDGIKGSKAEFVTITGNTITGHTGEESAIDFVGVRNAEVTNNRILDSAHHGVIIKGGSEDVIFENNLIDGIAKSGIEVGGYTELPFYWPGFLEEGLEFEVRNVVVKGNEITGTGGTGLRVVGGRKVEVVGNEIREVGNYLVSIDDSSLYHDTWFSGDLVFEGNSLDGRDWLRNRSEGENISETGNHTDGRDIVDADRIGSRAPDRSQDEAGCRDKPGRDATGKTGGATEAPTMSFPVPDGGPGRPGHEAPPPTFAYIAVAGGPAPAELPGADLAAGCFWVM